MAVDEIDIDRWSDAKSGSDMKVVGGPEPKNKIGLVLVFRGGFRFEEVVLDRSTSIVVLNAGGGEEDEFAGEGFQKTIGAITALLWSPPA